MIGWGRFIIRCRVTATRASAIRVSAFQPSAIGFGIPRLVPERLAPELLDPVPVTCHPEWISIRQPLTANTCFGVHDESCPYYGSPCGEALCRDAVPTLPKTARSARSADPTSGIDSIRQPLTATT